MGTSAATRETARANGARRRMGFSSGRARKARLTDRMTRINQCRAFVVVAHHVDAPPEAIEDQALVGRVEAVARKPDAEEHAIDSQATCDGRLGTGAALPGEQGLGTESG